MGKDNKAAGGKISFEIITDILYIVIKFQFFYCVLLNVYFNGYQNGRGSFQPVLYMSLLLIMLFVYWLSGKAGNTLTALGISTAAGILLALWIPIEGRKFWFLAASVIAAVSPFIRLQGDGNGDGMYGIRFRKLHRLGYWGFGIILVNILHTITNNRITDTYPLSPRVCQYYMIGSFIIYVTASILIQYTFRFMNYYREAGTIDAKSERQVRRSGLVAGTIILLSVFLVILLSVRPLNVLLNFLIPKVLYAVSFCALSLAGRLKELNTLDFNKITETAQSTVSGAAKVNRIGGAGIPGAPAILALLLLAGSGWLVWRIYKSILANYELGNDKAEFIPIHEKKEIEISDIKKPFYKTIWGNTNNEKIRKNYFRVIKRRMEKVKNHRLKSRTPKELMTVLGKGEADKKNIKKLTQYYEKARYGNEECSEEEVWESKKIIDTIEK